MKDIKFLIDYLNEEIELLESCVDRHSEGMEAAYKNVLWIIKNVILESEAKE